MRSFEPRWNAGALDEVRRSIGAFRVPDAARGTGWRWGCDPDVLERLVDRWRHDPAGERELADLARFPHFEADVSGVDLHVVRVEGEGPVRRPLLLLHGWPGSVHEYWDVIEPLTQPTRFGGSASDAFDVIIPSLPGHGFSSQPAGIVGPRRMAGIIDQFMREHLALDSYWVHGTDWGAGIGAWLALDHQDSVRALHLGYLLSQPDATPDTAAERAWDKRYSAAQSAFGAYSRLQETKPLSLALAAAGNPVGQLAWIVERFHDWTDLTKRPFGAVVSDDALLTDVAMYTHTGAFATTVRHYAHAEEEQARLVPAGRQITVPTSFSAYPSPAFPPPPRAWVERAYNVTRWSTMPEGGHFPALEVPELFVNDLRDWAASAG